jgi:alpha(1,3/1,4) fucosyltransferase
MKKKLKINFTDFYPGFNKLNNYFINILSKEYLVTIDESPDYLIYSCYGYDFLNYDCIKIFYNGENISPDFNLCDYGIGFAYLNFDDRYIRLPNFITYGIQPIYEFIKNRKSLPKSKFCNFIYSNSNADPNRDKFYHLLSKYKHVDSAGRHLNNICIPSTEKGWANDKIPFMKDYKFSIAFENSSLPGYTTEKIIHAFMAGTIPIYWGNPVITKDFNPDAFINCHAFKDFNKVVDKVIEIDQDNQLYIKMVNQPVFLKEPEYLQEDYLISFLRKIFNQPLENAKRRTKYGYNSIYENKYRINSLSQKVNKGVTFKLKQKIKSLITNNHLDKKIEKDDI